MAFLNLLDSLLDAITRLEGEALVMHVGEKPYVVTTAAPNTFRGPLIWGQVELSSRILTSEAVLGMLGQILPLEQRLALEELGAIEHEVVPETATRERFTVVAARGGDDIWLELRKHPKTIPEVEAPPAVEVPAPVEAVAAAPSEQDAPFEIVHDERQGVPTDAEVDALLAASAAALIRPEPRSSPDTPVAESIPVLVVEEPIEMAPEDVLAARAGIDSGLEAVDDTAESAASNEGLAPQPLAEEPLPLEVEEPIPVAEQPVQVATEPLHVAAEEPVVAQEEPSFVAEAPLPVLAEEPTPVAEEPVPVLAEQRTGLTAEPQSIADEFASMLAAEGLMAAEAPLRVVVEPARLTTERQHAADEFASMVAAEAPLAAEEPLHVVAEEPMPIAVEEPMPVAVEPLRVVAEEPSVAPAQPTLAAEAPLPILAEQPALVAEKALPQDTQPSELRAVVLPHTRRTIRPETSIPAPMATIVIEDLLRTAAARGASTLYVVAMMQPVIRTDGEISTLEMAPLAESDVDRLVLDLAPAAAREAWQHGASGEWMCDVADVGRVRCLTFRDHRGSGLIFQMIPPQAISADQLGLTPEVQALCSQSDGLVLLTGPRASGKSTLMNAFVDLINRTRSDHVITIEAQIGFVHESRRSFVSQREARGDSEALVGAVRAALREDPDVLLIDDLRSAEVAAVALEAAESGRLVFGSLTAASTVAAIDRLLELFPADRRVQAQGSLAGALRGVVAQVLVRRARGGRVAAREVLLNTPAVTALIEDGKTFQLPLAIESGRRHGMMPLNDALAAFVRDGTVNVSEAYRKAFDKDALLVALKREGVDTSFAERLG